MKSSIKSELEQMGTNVHPMNVHVHAHMYAYVYVYMPGLNVLGIYSLGVYTVSSHRFRSWICTLRGSALLCFFFISLAFGLEILA